MKCVVVGLGPMGRRHIQVLKELGLDVVGLCDKSEETIKKVSESGNYRDELFFTDSQIMIEKTKPELVVIATNSDSHFAITKISVENGAKFVFCEKPMANSVEDANNMMKICEENGVWLAINHQQRYMECYHKLKNIIYSNEMQGIETFSVVGANFGLAMNGSHYLELAKIFFNEQFEKISAFIQESPIKNPRGERFKDPGGIIFCLTKTGRKFILSAGVNEGCGITMILSGKYGNIIYKPLSGKTIFSYRNEKDREQPLTRYGLPAITREFDMPQDDIILSTKKVLMALLNREEEIKMLAKDSAEVVKILAASYLSSENNGVLINLEKEEFFSDRKFPWP